MLNILHIWVYLGKPHLGSIYPLHLISRLNLCYLRRMNPLLKRAALLGVIPLLPYKRFAALMKIAKTYNPRLKDL